MPKTRAPARLADETHDPMLYFARGEAWPASELLLFLTAGHRQHDLEEALLIRLGSQRGKRELLITLVRSPTIEENQGRLEGGKMEARAVSLCKGTGA
jgi:hypothetical protein